MEDNCHFLGEWHQGGCGGSHLTEALLTVCKRQAEVEYGQWEPFENFDGRAEDRDGADRGPNVAKTQALGIGIILARFQIEVMSAVCMDRL